MNDSVFVLALLNAIVVGTPILYAGIGEIVTQRSGIMNLGVEGMMLVGAVTGFWATTVTDNLLVAVIAGALGGLAMALLHAVLAISFRVNQIVSGLALVTLGTGLSAFIGDATEPPLTCCSGQFRFESVFGGGITELPIVGPLLFSHDIMVYASWLLAGLASYYIFRTPMGLSLRAVGENPGTADAVGIPVVRYRYLHTLIGGALAGIGGAYLSIAVLGAWQKGISAGVGWIAFALVVFSGWRPWRALFAAYVFGLLTGLNFTFQIIGVNIAGDFLAMVPFAMAILALIVVSARPEAARKLGAPAALAIPYAREQR
jgi:simple sugar transport system permease protein